MGTRLVVLVRDKETSGPAHFCLPGRVPHASLSPSLLFCFGVTRPSDGDPTPLFWLGLAPSFVQDLLWGSGRHPRKVKSVGGEGERGFTLRPPRVPLGTWVEGRRRTWLS